MKLFDEIFINNYKFIEVIWRINVISEVDYWRRE